MQEWTENGLYIEMVMSLIQWREPHDNIWPIRPYAWLYGNCNGSLRTDLEYFEDIFCVLLFWFLYWDIICNKLDVWRLKLNDKDNVNSRHCKKSRSWRNLSRHPKAGVINNIVQTIFASVAFIKTSCLFLSLSLDVFTCFLKSFTMIFSLEIYNHLCALPLICGYAKWSQ